MELNPTLSAGQTEDSAKAHSHLLVPHRISSTLSMLHSDWVRRSADHHSGRIAAASPHGWVRRALRDAVRCLDTELRSSARAFLLGYGRPGPLAPRYHGQSSVHAMTT